MTDETASSTARFDDDGHADDGRRRFPHLADDGVDALALGTTNAPYRRAITADELAECLRTGEPGTWLVHLTTFLTEVRPELVVEFARRRGIPIDRLAATYRSAKAATGENSPTLERLLDPAAPDSPQDAPRPG